MQFEDLGTSKISENMHYAGMLEHTEAGFSASALDRL